MEIVCLLLKQLFKLQIRFFIHFFVNNYFFSLYTSVRKRYCEGENYTHRVPWYMCSSSSKAIFKIQKLQDTSKLQKLQGKGWTAPKISNACDLISTVSYSDANSLLQFNAALARLYSLPNASHFTYSFLLSAGI